MQTHIVMIVLITWGRHMCPARERQAHFSNTTHHPEATSDPPGTKHKQRSTLKTIRNPTK